MVTARTSVSREATLSGLLTEHARFPGRLDCQWHHWWVSFCSHFPYAYVQICLQEADISFLQAESCTMPGAASCWPELLSSLSTETDTYIYIDIDIGLCTWIYKLMCQGTRSLTLYEQSKCEFCYFVYRRADFLSSCWNMGKDLSLVLSWSFWSNPRI